MTINLEPREVTVILDALSEKPYKEVASIIHKMVGQTGKDNENTKIIEDQLNNRSFCDTQKGEKS